MGRRFNLVNVTDLVKSILKVDQKARNSDSFLYLRVLRHIAEENGTNIDGVPIITFLLELQGKSFPTFEAVRRARQKLQREYPELSASEEVKAYRAENEAEVRAYARSEV